MFYGVAIKDGKLLVSEAFDKVKNSYFYRCLGGGIEFQETSKDALKREFMEEIGIDIIIGISRSRIYLSVKRFNWTSTNLCIRY